MDVNSLAALGLLVAGACLAFYLRRNRSPHGQGFSCQIGDQVFTGRFKVADGQVRVTYDGSTRAAPLGHGQPIQIAERLLADMHFEKQAR